MPAFRHLVGIAIVAAVVITTATAIGISASEHRPSEVLTKRLTPSKTDFRLNEYQQLRKILLGQEDAGSAR